MPKILRSSLQFLLAWSATNWAWGVPGIGGSAVLVAVVGVILNALGVMSLPLLVLLLAGIFLLALRPMALLVVSVFRYLGWHAPLSDAAEVGDVKMPHQFDPLTVVTEIQQVNLDGLQSAESYALFTFTVRNLSGYPIEITGVSGRLTCSSQPCTGPISVDRAPVKLSPSSYNRYTCEVIQPLGDGMMQHIALQGIQGDGTLYWQLGLSWVGTVELPEGNVPLRDCHLGVADFIVRGPISPDGASNLFKLSTTFASSEKYDWDGSPKRE